MKFLSENESIQNNISIYGEWLDSRNMAENTKRVYLSRIKQFLLFLEYANVGDQRIDESMRSYLDFLKQSRKEARSINAYINAFKNFSQFLELPSFNFKRERCYQKTSGALSGEEQQRYLKAAEQQKWSRDKAIAVGLLYTGLRISEFAKLNVQNISAGFSFIETSNGARIQLNQITRNVFREWFEERNGMANFTETEALWLTKEGERLSGAGLTFIAKRVGWKAGLLVSPELLRRTFLASTVDRLDAKELASIFGGYVSAPTIARFSFSIPRVSHKA